MDNQTNPETKTDLTEDPEPFITYEKPRYNRVKIFKYYDNSYLYMEVKVDSKFGKYHINLEKKPQGGIEMRKQPRKITGFFSRFGWRWEHSEKKWCRRIGDLDKDYLIYDFMLWEIFYNSPELFVGKDKYMFERIYTNCIYLVKGNDLTNRAAWYYVFVDRPKKNQFEANAKKSQIQLTDYGRILMSGYGQDPPKDVKEEAEKKYGFS